MLRLAQTPAMPPAPLTLAELFEEDYLPCRLVGCSADTEKIYRVAILHWERFPGCCTVAEIDHRTLARFAQWLLPQRSPATVNTYIRPILTLLRYAEECDMIPRAPRFRPLAEPKRTPVAYTTEEFRRILTVVDSLAGRIGAFAEPTWWRSLLSAAWETGLRIQALLAVRSEDVLLDQCGLYCQAEAQKDREGDWYPLSAPTCAAIAEIYSPTQELVWPSPITLGALRRRLRKIITAADIYCPKGKSAFHRFRKSTASYIAAAGGDAQRKLGHFSGKTTARYIDPRICRPTRGTDLVAAPL